MSAVPYETDLLGDLPFGESVNETGQRETLKLDVYSPRGAEGPRPAILWFHGGGFAPGNDKRQIYIPRLARIFAERGYVGIAPDYRVRANPNADLKGTVGDAVADGRMALNYVRAHTAELNIDAHRLALAGGSAGGILVLNLVHDPTQTPGPLSAVIDLWGTPAGGHRLFERVNRSSPPTLIVHGTADALVPYANSTGFSAELTAAGVPCRLLTLPNAPHTPLMHLDQIVTAAAELLAEVFK
jgi:acetyl esterase/lipase